MVLMRRKSVGSLLVAVALTAVAAGALAGVGSAKSRDDGRHSFHGNVGTIFAKQGAFTVKRANGSAIKFVTRPTTVYEHISSFSGLRKGVAIEVHAVNPNGRWIATKVETNPGGSGGGGSDDPPGDDHGSGGHGADDPPGDDHGSGGHGSDD
jgi:hypothetical protein